MILATVLAALATASAVALALPRPGPRAAPAPTRAEDPGADHGADHGDRSTDPRLLRAVASGGAGLAVVLLVPGWGGALGALVTGALVWRAGRRWESAAARRHRAALDAGLPHVVDLLVAALHVGAAPVEALERVAAVTGGAVADELQPWLSRLRLGADPVSVWWQLSRHPQLGRLGATLARSAESGAPIAEALDRLAHELADRARAEVQTRVRQVEVKAAVPLGVCLLPAFVLTGVVPLVAGSAARLLGS